ncbi:hypothetical protein [Bryobacter aggregatus]|uniref:hypothetical protein n=1 Tax=Bryobacter aggregatus TaxID=360054 RepID=UPI0004E0D039|nr:hypothetical protein [Bryobacter aggregatus]
MTSMEASLPIPTLASRPRGERTAEFLERRGRTVFADSGYWWASIDAGSRSFLSCSEHLVLPLQPEEVSSILRRHNGVAAQYANQDSGADSGVYLQPDRTYNFEHVQKRMRNFIRKGLQHFTIRPVEKADLSLRGIEINTDTMSRHQVFRDEFSDPELWNRNVEAIYGMEGTVCMGAYQDGLLVGYVYGVIDDGILFLMVQKSTNTALELHANPALLFETCRAAFASGQVRAISLGTVPFLNSPNLHHFKTRMGFELHPYKMRIQLHPVLEPFAHPGLLSFLANHASKLPKIGARLEYHAKLLKLGRGYNTQPLVEASTEATEHAGS